jgi:hypothetical protein
MYMSFSVRSAVAIAALGAALAGAPSAFAHHSFAMFDAQKILKLEGTVTEFQFTNPHSWLEVDVPEVHGGAVTLKHWSLEMNNLVGLRRAGWKPKSVQVGDKVSVTMHPMRDGSSAGQLLTVATADGRVLYGNGGPPAARVQGGPAEN